MRRGLFLSIGWLLLCAPLIAQEDDDEEPSRPGLIATYSDPSGNSFRRLDEAIAFAWGDASADSRIDSSAFTVQWRGQLFAQGAGEYRLALFASGEVEVKLAGQTVVPKQEVNSGWIFAKPVTLPFDHHPLEITFRKTKAPARIALYWSGPQFQLEPVPPRHLFHDQKEHFTPLFERGELLAAALRCTSCHRDEGGTQPVAAPSLLALRGNIHETWLQDWLTQDGKQQKAITRRMPAYGFSADEAAAIAAYLLQNQSGKEGPADPAIVQTSPKAGKNAKEPATAAAGERLFVTLGCLACHQVNDLGESGLFGGGDLSKIASKRPSGYYSGWLKEPARLNADHRMPVFDLSDSERSSLSVYLATLGAAAEPSKRQDASDLAVRGRKLISASRCASCHALPKDTELAAAESSKPLAATSDWKKSCALSLQATKSHLGYRLSEADQAALKEFFSARRAKRSEKQQLSGRLALVQNNCLACHAREGTESLSVSLPKKIADKLADVGQRYFELSAKIPAMTPPSLNSIGDKLHAEALENAIRRQGPPHRDYLLVRMPKFPLPDDELKRLVNYFITADRIPPRPEATPPRQDAAQTAAFSLAGSRLVSSDGFGCTSCHQIGKVVPDKAPLNARGPALSSLDKRVRKEWYDRFVRNPARIVPRMEMPSVQIPVRGVLDSKLDDQLAALWHVLSIPGFEPPEPNPFRVLRMAGGKIKDDPQVVLDTVQHQDATFTKPLLIVLPNRHNLLFDFESNRLIAWYVGDAAAQRSRGKSWFWRAEGHNLIVNRSPLPEISLLINGKELEPVIYDQVLAQPLRMSISSSSGNRRDGYVFQYALGFQSPDSANVVRLTVTQFVALLDTADASRTAVTRELFVAGAPEGVTVKFRALDPVSARGARWEGAIFKFDEQHKTQMTIGKSEWQEIRGDGSVIARRHDADRWPRTNQRGILFSLNYSTQLPIDRFEEEKQPQLPAEIAVLEISPGLKGIRLPLLTNILPTALAFQPNGTLAVATLTGRVFLAVDTHPKDGIEETTYTLADGLPAPYGLRATSESVEVLAKTSLIRVPAVAHNDRTMAFIASGWGHTVDYHDWAIGLPEDDGALYIGLPCQQDDRSPAGAKYRGAVAKLIPREPTKDDPREYSIELLTTGHRFPMGLAVNRDGDLFVTDNQGNYNPFNELNHVRKGAFFGFVNAIDKKNKDYIPPPVTEPAINIPHPWTRSVNGICFLYTPKKLREETGKDAFGPLEGQLVGCEYDTRRLIRMSLQKIGDTYQGCAYPLSQEPSSPEKGFLGPIVCAVSPRGELYVGSIRESGWGAGNNVGEIVKIKFEPEKFPCGIAEVRAVKGGFMIDFLREVDAKKAADLANYSISSYRRISTPAYGGPDVDRRTEKVGSVELAADRRRATVHLPDLRTGFVYEIQLKNVASASAEFFPAEAYFTLHGVP